MKLVNLSLFTPDNVLAIGAIIFFWSAMIFLMRSIVTLPTLTAPTEAAK